MGLAILGVLVLVFIGLAVLSGKTWQIWQVLTVIALFIATFAFMALAAATLRTQEVWRSRYTQATEELEREQQTHELLTRGEPGSDEPALPEIEGAVRRQLVDRGRVWRNLTVADIGQGTVTLDATNWGDEACQQVGLDSADEFAEPEPIPEEADGAPAAPGTKPLGLQTGAIVHAFHESPAAGLPEPVQQALYGDDPLVQNDPQGRCKVPTFYLGEFKIVNDPQAQPTSITLTPTLPLSEMQIEQLQQPDISWVLYEVLPVDSHDRTNGDTLSGLTAEQLRALIPQVGEDEESYNALIEEFVRDQERASDMDPPERKWMKVRFTDSYAVDVDVQEPVSLPDTSFDPSGRSNADNLRQFDKTQFERGEEATFDFATAQELINQGVAEAVEPIYARRLRDYERSFRAFADQVASLDREIAVAREDIERIDESIETLNRQIAFYQQRRQQMSADRDGFNMERDVITAYRDSLEQQWKEVLNDLSRLYRSNKQLVRQLSSRSGDAARRTERTVVAR